MKNIIYWSIIIGLVMGILLQIPHALDVEVEMRQQQQEEIWRLYEQGN